MVVKSFRGTLVDGGQDRISLSTIQGKVGYRITKLSIMVKEPFAKDQQSIMKVYNKLQTTVDGVVNFSDSGLLAAALNAMDSNLGAGYYGMYQQDIIFDTQIFNQDIYVTYKDDSGGEACNYYIELEVIPLTDQGAEYTTIKDIRSNA